MPKPEPIREGDAFKFKGMRQPWVVIGTRPFGGVDLFCKEKLHFMDTSCQQLRLKIANGTVKKIDKKPTA